MWTSVSAGNHYYMGVEISPWEGAILREEKGRSIAKYRDTLP